MPKYKLENGMRGPWQLCGESPGVIRLWGRRGFTRQPENSKRAHLSAPAVQTPPKFHEKTPRETKRANFAAGEGKKREILAVTAFGQDHIWPKLTGRIWPSLFGRIWPIFFLTEFGQTAFGQFFLTEFGQTAFGQFFFWWGVRCGGAVGVLLGCCWGGVGWWAGPWKVGLKGLGPEGVGARRAGGPKGWGPQGLGAPRAGGPKGWGPQGLGAPRAGGPKGWGPQGLGAPRAGGPKGWGPQGLGAPRAGGEKAGGPKGWGREGLGARRVGGPKGWGPEGLGARRVGGPKGWGPEGWGGPKGGGPEGWGARRVGGPKGGGPEISVFFPLPPQNAFFLLSGGSSRGILVVFVKAGTLKCARLEFSGCRTKQLFAKVVSSQRSSQPGFRVAFSIWDFVSDTFHRYFFQWPDAPREGPTSSQESQKVLSPFIPIPLSVSTQVQVLLLIFHLPLHVQEHGVSSSQWKPCSRPPVNKSNIAPVRSCTARRAFPVEALLRRGLHHHAPVSVRTKWAFRPQRFPVNASTVRLFSIWVPCYRGQGNVLSQIPARLASFVEHQSVASPLNSIWSMVAVVRRLLLRSCPVASR